MKYVLGIDFGGSSSKATLLREDGIIAATHTASYPTLYPQPGWVEQDPEDWLAAAKENIRALLRETGISPEEIAAVALDAATHTAVLLDENQRVLMPSIYWTDTRSQPQVQWLRENHKDLILAQVLNNPDTIWTLPQLLWVRENRPEIWEKVRKILFAKDYVRHMLTGDLVTDNIEAEGSMLFDYNRQCWSEELCGILELDMDVLPTVVQPMDITGYVTEEASRETGLSCKTAVICGSTDTVMEVFCAGAVSPGQMTVKLATAGRICVITDHSCPSRHLVNYSHVLPGLWYPGTATKSCAASFRWYKHTFGEDYDALYEQAESVAPGCDGLMFHPYLNGELTPYADPKLCGSFIGIRAGHTKAHFSRAVLEGVAFSLMDCMQALDTLGIRHEDHAVIIGRGGQSPLWRQITADALGLKLCTRTQSDSSFGSAMLAGVRVGLWTSPEAAVEACNRTVDTAVPNAELHEKYLELFDTYRRVHDALAEIYHGRS